MKSKKKVGLIITFSVVHIVLLVFWGLLIIDTISPVYKWEEKV